MRDTSENMDIKIEQKVNKKEVLEDKRGLPDCNVIEEMNKLGLNKISSKRKRDRITDGLNNAPNSHKYNTNKKQ